MTATTDLFDTLTETFELYGYEVDAEIVTEVTNELRFVLAAIISGTELTHDHYTAIEKSSAHVGYALDEEEIEAYSSVVEVALFELAKGYA